MVRVGINKVCIRGRMRFIYIEGSYIISAMLRYRCLQGLDRNGEIGVCFSCRSETAEGCIRLDKGLIGAVTLIATKSGAFTGESGVSVFRQFFTISVPTYLITS